jgi:hypothetical protein
LEARLTAANYFEGLWEQLMTEDFRALTPLFHLRDPRILLDIWQMHPDMSEREKVMKGHRQQAIRSKRWSTGLLVSSLVLVKSSF